MADFDWVTARAECSSVHVFNLLAEKIDSDVKNANALQRGGVDFIFTRMEGKIIIALLKDRGDERQERIEARSVVFELSASVITAVAKDGKGNETPLFSAIPRMQSAGPCRLEINGTALELWQVSMRALEDLFFRL